MALIRYMDEKVLQAISSYLQRFHSIKEEDIQLVEPRGISDDDYLWFVDNDGELWIVKIDNGWEKTPPKSGFEAALKRLPWDEFADKLTQFGRTHFAQIGIDLISESMGVLRYGDLAEVPLE